SLLFSYIRTPPKSPLFPYMTLFRSNQMLLGHEVVRLALDAEKLAQRRSFQAALENERQENAREISDLESRYRTARTEAERAALKERTSTRLNSSHVKTSYAVSCSKI